MDAVEKRVLSKLRSRLVKEVVVTESFLCAFCDSNILDDQMSRILKTENDHEQRASKLLDILPSRGSKAFGTLLEILENTNPWLAEKMKASLHEERNKDAKINIPPTMSENATIEGYGQSRLHIDTDIKERATKYVKANLNHLTEVEQRGVDKWLADELQRERRRQQFRAPHNVPRNPHDFHSTKECQTETTNMDLKEMYEEIIIYIHGVDYREMSADFSFERMQAQIRELLTRTRKLDALFLNCLNKFDDSDKYSTPLPDLIERVVSISKERNNDQYAEEKRVRQKLIEERDHAKRQVRRLEEEMDKLLQRQQSQSLRPQEIQLRHRQNVNLRYSLLVPEHTQSKDTQRVATVKSDVSGGSPRDQTKLQGNARSINNSTSNSENTTTNIDHSSNNSTDNEEVTASSKIMVQQSAPSRDSSIGNSTPRAAHSTTNIVYEDAKPPQQHVSAHGSTAGIGGGVKIRRHASEESLKIALSKEEAETTSVSKLPNDSHHSTQLNLHLARRKSQDAASNHHNSLIQQHHHQTRQSNTQSSQKQNKTQQQIQQQQLQQQQQQAPPPKQATPRISRADLQSRMQRMLLGAAVAPPSQKPRAAQKARRSESEKAVPTHSRQHSNSSSATSSSSRAQDASRMFQGNPSLQASYDNIVSSSAKKQDRVGPMLGNDGVSILVTSSSTARAGSAHPHQQRQHHHKGNHHQHQHSHIAQSHHQPAHNHNQQVQQQQQQQQAHDQNYYYADQEDTSPPPVNPYRMFIHANQTQAHSKSAHSRNSSQHGSHHNSVSSSQDRGGSSTSSHQRHQGAQRSHSSDRSAERVLSHKNPYLAFLEQPSSVSYSGGASGGMSRSGVQQAVSHDYGSDSEVVTGFRARVANAGVSPERSHKTNRVRFASPVAGGSSSGTSGGGSTSPTRKSHGRVGSAFRKPRR